jgi:glycosyltransferase involved in cell wall biosynthesis
MNKNNSENIMGIPRLSILMSVYNGGQYLGECVESILNQTFKDFEFIIVDDGSSDNTWEILTHYAKQDERIVLLRNQPNMGVVKALNKGLDSAQAQIIARQDADDISHSERLQRQIDFLDQHPDYGLVAVVPMLVGTDGSQLERSHYTATSDKEIQEHLLDFMCLCGPTIMMRRASLEQAGFYFAEGLDASEDYDICLRMAEVTKLASLEGHLYKYRQQPESASSKRSAQQMFNKAVALERAISRRYGNHPPENKIATVARDYLHAAIIAFSRHNPELACLSLERAQGIYPFILETNQPIEDLVRAYTPDDSIKSALNYTDSIFKDLFPGTKLLLRMRMRLLSYLHMSQVFDGARNGNFALVNQHLWAGIRGQPSWLLDKGVISIFAKSLFKRSFKRADQ